MKKTKKGLQVNSQQSRHAKGKCTQKRKGPTAEWPHSQLHRDRLTRTVSPPKPSPWLTFTAHRGQLSHHQALRLVQLRSQAVDLDGKHILVRERLFLPRQPHPHKSFGGVITNRHVRRGREGPLPGTLPLPQRTQTNPPPPPRGKRFELSLMQVFSHLCTDISYRKQEEGLMY